MKTLSKNQFWVLSFCIKLIPLLFMLVVWNGDLWAYRKNIAIYIAWVLIEATLWVVFLLFFKSKPMPDIEQRTRSQELLDTFYVVAAGFLCMYSVYTTDENDILRLVFATMALSLMYRGNRQSLIRQDAPNAGLMHEYSERTYKKSQRISGRILFGVGLFGLLMFLAVPSQYVLWAMGLFFSALFVGAFVLLYKSGKAVDE
jgi:hypothetical protein